MPVSSLTVALLCLAAPQGEIKKPSVHKGTLLIEAKRIYITADRVLKNSAILVRNGKVLYLGKEIPAAAREGATKVDFKTDTIVPGFVNPHCSLGHGLNLAERIDTFTPELQASDAFDPFVEQLAQAARLGITAVGLSPSSYNAFAGQAAAVRTGNIGSILSDSTYLKMSMLDAAFDQNRYPTSRMGAADLIRKVFSQARSPLGPTDPRLKIIHDVITGARPLVFHVQREAEINAVLELAKELSIKPLLLGCEEGHKCLDAIAKYSAGVILSPMGFATSTKRLTFPGKLEKKGVPFSFMAERQADLRITAALAVRHGASRTAALKALTSIAAKHCDIDTLAGGLYQGRSADFVVFDGDPLNLTSQLRKVYIAGLPFQTKAK